jgi:hypothetical protein
MELRARTSMKHNESQGSWHPSTDPLSQVSEWRSLCKSWPQLRLTLPLAGSSLHDWPAVRFKLECPYGVRVAIRGFAKLSLFRNSMQHNTRTRGTLYHPDGRRDPSERASLSGLTLNRKVELLHLAPGLPLLDDFRLDGADSGGIVEAKYL